jgi:hypothetical protein
MQPCVDLLEHFRVLDHQRMYLHRGRCHNEVVLPVYRGGSGKREVSRGQEMMRRRQVATSEVQNAADSPTYDDSHMLTASAKQPHAPKPILWFVKCEHSL